MRGSKYTGIVGSGAYALYRLRDVTGRVLYVGVSNNVFNRLSQHAADKRWWPLVDPSKVTVEWFETAEAVAEAEDAAIAAEQPMFNNAGVTHPASRYSPARRHHEPAEREPVKRTRAEIEAILDAPPESGLPRIAWRMGETREQTIARWVTN